MESYANVKSLNEHLSIHGKYWDIETWLSIDLVY